jgi:predicted nucleic acid-binding protein
LDDAVLQAANGQASLSLMSMAVTGFMRITSNPKIFKQTDPLTDVCDFIDSLLSCPGVQFLYQTAAWPNMRQLCLTQQIKGDLISDAWIAATVMQTGETLCTFDRDFTRLLPSDQLILLKP